jgi:hypothetical protein
VASRRLPSPEEATEQQVKDLMMELLWLRGRGDSICPSEVARGLAHPWRPLMPLVQEVANELAEQGELEVVQRGESVDWSKRPGAVRLRLPSPSESEPDLLG